MGSVEGVWVWERFPRVPAWHSRHKCYAQMGYAQAATMPRTVGCRSSHLGEGEQLPCTEVLHSQGSRLLQLSWSQTKAPEPDAGGCKPTWLPTPKLGRRVAG